MILTKNKRFVLNWHHVHGQLGHVAAALVQRVQDGHLVVFECIEHLEQGLDFLEN